MDLTAAPPPHWRLVDRLLAGYGVLVAAVALTRLHQPGVPGVLAAHLAVPALAWLVVHAPPTPLARVLRGIYPVVLLIPRPLLRDRRPQPVRRRRHVGPPDPGGRAGDLRDAAEPRLVARPSERVLVGDAARDVPLVLFPHRHAGDRLSRAATPRRARALFNGLLATYLACYLFYIFMPVSGPYYQFARPSGAFVANLPARMVYGMLRGGSAFGAAFPSSHVAATVAATIGAWRGWRWLGTVMAVPTAFLAVAVVYCQMHYAVDSAAGLMLGCVVAGVVTRS